MKTWQIYDYFECPECGGPVRIYTKLQKNDDDAEFWERDPVECMECDCETEIAINESCDPPQAYIMHLD